MGFSGNHVSSDGPRAKGEGRSDSPYSWGPNLRFHSRLDPVGPFPPARSCWRGKEPCFEYTVTPIDHLDPQDPRSLYNEELIYFVWF